MLAGLRQGRLICVAVVSAAVMAPAVVAAQSPIDVPTVVTIAPQEEAPSDAAPRSSFDYEAARTASAARPWDAPGVIAAAVPAPHAPQPSPPMAFTGAAPPLACRHADYRIIIDDRSDLRSGTLCILPDGSWQLLP
jgi:hypothetical protein